MFEDLSGGWIAAGFTAFGYCIKIITDWLLARQKQQATIEAEANQALLNHWQDLFKTAVQRSDALHSQVNSLTNQVNNLHLQHSQCQADNYRCLAENEKMLAKIKEMEGRLSTCEIQVANGKNS